jgi:CelD/BcsL family acetyltransferase involved in cellulose biosynthesis
MRHHASLPRVRGWRGEIADAARVPAPMFADWVRLAARCDLPLVAGPHWMRCFQRAFVAPGQGQVHALYRGDRPIGMVPVVRRRRLSRALLAMANEHSPIWSFALDTSVPYAAEHLLERLLADTDALLFGRLRRTDPACRELARAAAAQGLPVSLHEYSGDACIELGHSFDEVSGRWSTGMAKEARRRLRKGEKCSDLAVERLGEADDPDRLAGVLQTCFALEARTWKGDLGTAIQSEPRVQGFYEELARSLAVRGELALYVMRRAGQVIAFDYGLRGAGRLDSLKVAFDPDHAQLAPGNLLTLELLRREIKDRIVGAVHLGRPSASKARFTTAIEPLVSLRIYGSKAAGRTAYLAGPVLRSRLKKVAWIRQLHEGSKSVAPSAKRAWKRLRGGLEREYRQWLLLKKPD